MTDQQELQQQLEQRRLHLRSRIAAIQADFANGRSGDWAEQAQERENEETLGEIERESADELRQIDAALRLLQSGQYGLCTACGEPIAPERLRAIPYTTRCIQCAQGGLADAH